MSKAILYYTCCQHSLDIEFACRAQLQHARALLPLITVSLKPIDFGDRNVVLLLNRSPESMHKQILTGLQEIDEDYVFLAESDVLYHQSHFEFVPPREDTFYYNTNVIKARYPDGHLVWTDGLQQVSGICASRDVLLDFYSQRVEQIEREGFNRHYEPGPKQTVGSKLTVNWLSEFPNIDIRHNATLTRSKWSPDEFRNKQYAKGWREFSEADGWGRIEGRLTELLAEISRCKG